MRKKKIPHSIYASVSFDGNEYGVKLHGRSKKRVIAYYWYVDATGGFLPNLETNSIYDKTFNSDIEARAVANDFYKNPDKLEKFVIDRYGKEYVLTNSIEVANFRKQKDTKK